MSIALAPVTLVIGQQQNVILDYATEALIVTNKSLVDVQYSGFGVLGSDWIPAGQQIILHREINSSGQISFLAFNPGNLSPLPVNTILLTSFSSGETPVGTWPQTVPNPTVIALSTQTVINTGNASGTVVVFAEPVGDTDPTGPVNIKNNGIVQFGDATFPGELLIVGAAPSATFIFPDHIQVQNIQGVLANLAANKTTGSGTTSGNATIWEPLTGTTKLLVVEWTNYQTTIQDVALPVPFTDGALFFIGELGSLASNQMRFISNALGVTCSVLETISATGAGGTQGPFTVIRAWSFGQVRGGFDTLEFTMGAASGGFLIVLGK